MKPYVKPELHYESFELVQHIAGCSLTPISSGDPETCRYSGVIGGVESQFWFIAKPVCDVPVDDYCYANSNSNITTINS